MNIAIKKDKPLFDDSWESWVQLNIERHCSRRDMLNVLIEHGFEESDAITYIASGQEKVVSHIDFPDNESERDTVFIPTAKRQAVDGVELFTVDNFVSDEECARLINLMRENLRRSTVTGEENISQCRTSRSCDLTILRDPFIEEIDARICNIMGLSTTQPEPIQGQWYNVGEEFQPHTDYFDPGSSDFHEHTADMGQRTWTFMLYLNTTRKGGKTAFPELEIDFTPQAGTAVIWNNLDEKGNLNPLTLHHGMPVEEGFKVIITKWFRSKSPELKYRKEANEYLKPLTRDGFLKTKMPTDLYQKIEGFYQQNTSHKTDEHLPCFIKSKQPNSDNTPSELIELSSELRQTIHEALLPLVEAWVGDYLEPTYVFGIRNYKRGSILKVHRDRLETHVASVILNIRQTVDKDWFLYIEDHKYKQHQIALAEGEMLFYEGARLAHGRPSALEGDEFANVFVHYNLKKSL